MPPPTKARCTSCGGSLEEGYIPDAGEYTFPPQIWASVWVRGTPRPRKGILSALGGGGIDTAGDAPLALEAYRCTECGHLELFANRQAGHKTTTVG